ncbi:hypothetical protein MKX01_035743 [Papaver californicum]|nr:hypothetical protein MKX01_035743 [Papaver californicum]
MEGIEQKNVLVNGINMHVAEKGNKEHPAIFFLHGFPELWYSWRHQILSLSSLGYRCIAPDLRGYGDTDAPTSIHSYSVLHIVGDLVSLINTLGLDQVFVVGHDWGALIAWYFCLLRPDRVKALVNMSVAFPTRAANKPIERLRAAFGDDYYICRFQEPGIAEAEFARSTTVNLITKFFATRAPGPLCVLKETGFGGSPNKLATLPSCKFDLKGFTGGLNYYCALDLSWELTAPWCDVEVKVPVKYIVGNEDVTYTTPGAKEYVHGGGFKKDVPFLQEVVVMEGVAHFLNQEIPDEVNEHIYNFILKF